MGIKWLDKSYRSPVSCKEISREQVANRSRSQCKQGFSDVYYCSALLFILFDMILIFFSVMDQTSRQKHAVLIGNSNIIFHNHYVTGGKRRNRLKKR